MRVQILTLGTYGDVRPYLALALGLRARGHDAELLGPDHFERFAVPAGVSFRGLGPHYAEDELKGVIASLAREPDEKLHPSIILRQTHASTLALGARAIELTKDADLIVAHNLSVLGFVAAQANAKPFVTGHLFPSLIPSSRTWITGRDFGRFVNPLLWRLAGRVVARTTDPLYSEVLSAFGLPKKRHIMLKSGHSRLANLVAVSPRILPYDPNWPRHYECTGYWILSGTDVEPDPELRAFVEGAEPPVVITFGSMYGIDASAMTKLLLDAVAGCGRRVVLQAGWAGLGAGELPAHVRRAEFVSHEWLFRKAACIVHHGGAGTTGAALRAGKPQIITYHLGDQQFWCRHMLRLGVSAGGIAQRNLSAGWLSQAVRRALSGRTRARRAGELAAELTSEDGVGRAIDILERVGVRVRAGHLQSSGGIAAIQSRST